MPVNGGMISVERLPTGPPFVECWFAEALLDATCWQLASSKKRNSSLPQRLTNGHGHPPSVFLTSELLRRKSNQKLTSSRHRPTWRVRSDRQLGSWDHGVAPWSYQWCHYYHYWPAWKIRWQTKNYRTGENHTHHTRPVMRVETQHHIVYPTIAIGKMPRNLFVDSIGFKHSKRL